MKTRTLLLWALACGVAIMLAGAVFLFQLVSRDELAEPIPVGATTQVGDMRVTVLAASEAGGELVVEVALEGTVDDQPADAFSLIASGRRGRPASSTCASAPSDACTVTFDTSAADGSSRVLFYERGEDQARWVLG